MAAGSTPSRYSSAVPRRCWSSACRLRNAICSGSRGSTSDSSVKTCARLWPARSRTNASSGDSLTNPSSSRWLSQTGRPTATSCEHDLVDPLAIDAGPAGSCRGWPPATAPPGSARRSARRRARAARPSAARCETQTENTRASRRRTRVVLVRIEQRVGQLADVLFGDLPQREQRVVGERLDGQQRDDVRHERRPPALRLATARSIDRARGCCDRSATDVAIVRRAPPADIAVVDAVAGGSRRRRRRLSSTFRGRVVRRVTRQVEAARPLDEAVFERAEVPAVQAARGDDRAGRAGHREPENRRTTAPPATNTIDEAHQRRRRPHRRAGRTPTSMSDLAARFSAAGIGV